MPIESSPDTITTTPDSDVASHVIASSDGAVQGAVQGATENTSLWDKAYDALSNEKPDLMDKYEALLSEVLAKGKVSIWAGLLTLMLTFGDAAQTESPTALNEVDSGITNKIPHNNPAARRAKMKDVTELGLKHMEDNKVTTTLLGHRIDVGMVVAGTAGILGQAMGFIKEAVKDVPYASVITAGISLILPLLENPTATEKANQDGLVYVVSQLRYYTAMESLLLPEGLGTDLKNSLADGLVDLYKQIIDFEVQSVLRLYRGRFTNLVRGVVEYDDWEKQVKNIEIINDTLLSKFQTAIFGSGLRELLKLASEAKKHHVAFREHLDGVHGVLQSIHQDPKNEACLQSLRTTDPRDDKDRIMKIKGGLLEDLNHWVFDNDDFKQWSDDPESRLLWVKGDPGKGKTMLLCGIIDKLEKSVSGTDKGLTSFFFCQATDSRINSATAVLRGIIYMLVDQQRGLLSHTGKI